MCSFAGHGPLFAGSKIASLLARISALSFLISRYKEVTSHPTFFNRIALNRLAVAA